MKLKKAEIDYKVKLYNHGMNHLLDDTISNRIIYVHNLHWIVENLLQKATKDWHDIDFTDGFEDVFRIFCNKKIFLIC